MNVRKVHWIYIIKCEELLHKVENISILYHIVSNISKINQHKKKTKKSIMSLFSYIMEVHSEVLMVVSLHLSIVFVCHHTFTIPIVSHFSVLFCEISMWHVIENYVSFDLSSGKGFYILCLFLLILSRDML